MGKAQHNCNEDGSFSIDVLVLTHLRTKQQLQDGNYMPLFPIRWRVPAWVVCWLEVNVNDTKDPDKHIGVASCEPITS